MALLVNDMALEKKAGQCRLELHIRNEELCERGVVENFETAAGRECERYGDENSDDDFSEHIISLSVSSVDDSVLRCNGCTEGVVGRNGVGAVLAPKGREQRGTADFSA